MSQGVSDLVGNRSSYHFRESSRYAATRAALEASERRTARAAFADSVQEYEWIERFELIAKSVLCHLPYALMLQKTVTWSRRFEV